MYGLGDRLYYTISNISRSINVLIFNGHKDETMSMNCGRVLMYSFKFSKPRVMLTKFISPFLSVLTWEAQHCLISYMASPFYIDDKEAIKKDLLFPSYLDD